MLAELTVDVNGINAAYGVVLLAIFYFVVTNVPGVLKMGSGILRGLWHAIAMHRFVLADLVKNAGTVITGGLICASLMAVTYIGNYHLRGPNFTLGNGWFSVPAVAIGIFLFIVTVCVYLEAGEKYYLRNHSEQEVVAYHKCRKCQKRWSESIEPRWRRKRDCERCDVQQYCKVGLKIMGDD